MTDSPLRSPPRGSWWSPTPKHCRKMRPWRLGRVETPTRLRGSTRASPLCSGNSTLTSPDDGSRTRRGPQLAALRQRRISVVARLVRLVQGLGVVGLADDVADLRVGHVEDAKLVPDLGDRLDPMELS